MSELAKAYVQIIPTSQGMGNKLKEIIDGEANSAGKSGGLTLGNALAGGIGLASAAIGAASAAVGKFASEAVSSYANYEQLVGGVEKLYGEAAGKLEQFANEAYKTSGMSANAYMDTATSFSAALVNSLGGDVDKAADMTDVAMRAMSDNVNVFGSDFTSVQNAFQGFAKQNYTMLDNLKLGYGGTKTEMERLIADANKYRASIGETANLSIDSFADVVQAIQSVQEAQGIAGTTNKEAMSTIEGSAMATKAAWQNVITAIGRGEGLKEALDGLTSSLFGNGDNGFLSQIIPRIQTTMEGIGEFIQTAGPLFADKIPALIDSILPTLLNAGMTLLKAIGDGILQAIPMIMPIATDVVMTLAEALISALPQILSVGTEAIVELVLGISESLPTLIPVALEAILTIVEGLLDNTDKLISAALQLMIGLAEGIIKALPKLIEKAPIIISKLVTAIIQAVPQLLKAATEIIAKLATGILASVGRLLTAGVNIIRQLYNSIVNAISNFSSIGTNIVQGIKNGIANAWNNMVSWFKGLFGDLIQIAKDILGIASPSKVFEQIGEYTTEGFDEGMADFGKGAMEDVQTAMDDISNIKPNIDPATLKSNIKTDYSVATTTTAPDIDRKLDTLISLLSGGVNVTLEGDAQGLFRQVRKEVNQFTRSTGNSPFIAPA